MYTPEQMLDVLTTHYGYSLDDLPISLGGSHNQTFNNHNHYQECLSTVTDPRSICYPYYTLDTRPLTAKPTSNILFFNTDHHHKKKETSSTSAATTTSSSTSLVAIVALRRNHDSSSTQVRARKRESSSSTDDGEKRRRSNESLIEEEPPISNALTYIPQEIPFE